MAVDLAPYLARMKTRVGLARGPISRRIEAGEIIKFARSIGETRPLYSDEAYARTTRFGALVAPPTFVSTFPQLVFDAIMDFDIPLGRFLHSDDIVENDRPICAGDVITATARYADAYVRNGANGPLLFQAADLTLINQRNDRVAQVRVVSVSFE